MKILKYSLMLVGGLFLSMACKGINKHAAVSDSDTVAQNKGMHTMNGKGKVLIVYFSHAGENYSVGNIKVGNTKIVADEIKKVTGGDVFEIIAEKNYDMPYMQLVKVAQEETENGEKPAYKGDVENLERYDTIFIGGPIWWGTYPQVMFTFFDKHDMNGKVIVPFTTHEGSGLGSVVEDLKRLYPKANVTNAFSIAGHQVRGGLGKVDDWLKGIGY